MPKKSSKLFLLSWRVWEGTVCWHYNHTLRVQFLIELHSLIFAQHASSQEAPSTRFIFKVLFQGLTDSGIYYHCHHPRWHALSYYLVCVRASVLKWTDGDGSVSVFGITLQFTILVAWSPPMSPPSSGKVNIIVQEKSISQIWLDQPAA
jgi:hypothetical protein